MKNTMTRVLCVLLVLVFVAAWLPNTAFAATLN